VENLIPPFPGDTITVFGAYLAGRGFLDPLLVFASTTLGNLATNLFLYYVGLRRGREFIRKHRRLFHEDLLPRIALFYRKWGVWTILFSRLLVGLRPIVPLFAGVSRLRPRKFILPIICGIVIQHALMVYLGYTVGQKWEFIKSILKDVNLGLGLVALAVAILIFLWFRSVRKSRLKRAMRRNSQ
jgi:membrane protein DedA with SNARE-associated domain